MDMVGWSHYRSFGSQCRISCCTSISSRANISACGYAPSFEFCLGSRHIGEGGYSRLSRSYRRECSILVQVGSEDGRNAKKLGDSRSQYRKVEESCNLGRKSCTVEKRKEEWRKLMSRLYLAGACGENIPQEPKCGIIRPWRIYHSQFLLRTFMRYTMKSRW